MRAWLNLRLTVPERRRVITAGLTRLGYQVIDEVPVHVSPQPNDLLITWNRIGRGDYLAKLFNKAKGRVIVIENATWGNAFAGRRWYHMTLDYHNTAGCFPVGADSRWDELKVSLEPWRTDGQTLILPQRGIGSKPTAMPSGWAKRAQKRYHAPVRPHPGKRESVPLEKDLADCGRVITWGSGAAVKALMMGIPVISEMPNWIAAQDNTDAGRLAMFRRLAWAQWTLAEIEQGKPFQWLLDEGTSV